MMQMESKALRNINKKLLMVPSQFVSPAAGSTINTKAVSPMHCPLFKHMRDWHVLWLPLCSLANGRSTASCHVLRRVSRAKQSTEPQALEVHSSRAATAMLAVKMLVFVTFTSRPAAASAPLAVHSEPPGLRPGSAAR